MKKLFATQDSKVSSDSPRPGAQRRLSSSGSLASVLVLVLFAAPGLSVAGTTLNANPNMSMSTVKLGALNGVVTPRSGTGTATLVSPKGAATLAIQESVWNTTSYEVGTSLFTGVPNLSNLWVTGRNPDIGINTTEITRNGNVQNPVGPGSIDGWIGFKGMIGQVRIGALGFTLPVNVSKAGCCSVETTIIELGINDILVTFGPWMIGDGNSITMTNLSTNVIQMPGRALGDQTGVGFTLNPTSQEEVRTFTVAMGFKTSNPNNSSLQASQVIIGGTSNFPSSANGTGTISMVTPLRVSTGSIAGTIPGIQRLKFSFVPEPGVLFLLVSGALGLTLVGRARLRK